MTQKESISVAVNLLAALYAAPHQGPAILSVLPDAKMFPDLSTGAIYAEMLQHGIRGGSLDYALLNAQINARSQKAYEYLTGKGSFMLAQRTHEDDASMMVAWAEMLAEHYRNNQIAKDLEAHVKLAREGSESTPELVSRIIGQLRGYVEEGAAGMEHIRKAASLALERVDEWKAGKVTDVLLTGMPSLDDNVGGLPTALMTVWAGMTSGFKTAALVELMKRLALRFEKRDDKQAVVIFSAEMSSEKLVHRMAASLSGVPASNLRPTSGAFTPRKEEYERYEEAISRISRLEIYINQEPSPSLETMYAQCMNIQARMPIAFVGFDYLEKMDVDEKTEELRVSKIAKNLSALAKRINRPVLTLSQYSRAAESSKGQAPKNYWLRYSGKIEQEAAVIIHWHYPKYFVDGGVVPQHSAGEIFMWEENEPNAIWAVCTKNRDGKRGSNTKFFIEVTTGRFTDPKDERFEEHPTANASEAPF